MRRRILFLCTGNSARSQMAEGLVNHYWGDEWQAYSAGTKPAGHVHPLAVQVMSELDIDISRNRSKSVDELREEPFDVVVTVCDDAAENCPVWLPAPGATTPGGSGRTIHIGFEDPAQAVGSDGERLAVFRRVRDEIRREILHLLGGDNGEKHDTSDL
jgi:arsenate reductase